MNKKQPESKKQPDADFSWVDDYEERPASKQPPSQPTGEEADAEDLFAAPPVRDKIDLALEDTQEIQEEAPSGERQTLRGKQTRRRTRPFVQADGSGRVGRPVCGFGGGSSVFGYVFTDAAA